MEQETNQIRFRPATMKDTEYLFWLRNQEKVRVWCLYTDKVTKAEHVKWMKRALKNEGMLVYIITVNNVIVGRASMTKIDSVFWELHYALDPRYWGKGYAKNIMALFDEIAEKEGIKKFAASVRVDNIPSLRALTRAGFKTVYHGADHYRLHKEVK